MLPAPCTPNRCTTRWFLHGDGRVDSESSNGVRPDNSKILRSRKFEIGEEIHCNTLGPWHPEVDPPKIIQDNKNLVFTYKVSDLTH